MMTAVQEPNTTQGTLQSANKSNGKGELLLND